MSAERDPRLPKNRQELDAYVKQQDARKESLVQILNALDYPIVRINANNTMDFINNAFFEYAEVDGFGEKLGDDLREEWEGKDFLEFLNPENHEAFEFAKQESRERRMNVDQNHFRVGVDGEFEFNTAQGTKIPMLLSVTYSKFYDTYQLNFRDIRDLVAVRAELLEAHEDLEARVEERTAELEGAFEEIRRQQEEMVELSTPVIQVWESVLMMPLIGVVDTMRAAQMTERLLDAITASESQVVIVDVTGVPVIDTSVGRHFIQTVTAAKMLGAEVVITGFSPDAAQTITQLGIDFSEIRTRGTLRAGIKEAVALVDKRKRR